MAEEFKSFPTTLQHFSSMLAHDKQRRTVFICCVISLMALTSMLSVIACPRVKNCDVEDPVNPLPVQAKAPERKQTREAPDAGLGSSRSLDELILNFLSAALRDDMVDKDKESNSKNKSRSDDAVESSNIEVKLSHIVDGSANRAERRSRKEVFRFYKYEKYFKDKKHSHRNKRHKTSSDIVSKFSVKSINGKDKSVSTRKLMSIFSDNETSMAAMRSCDSDKWLDCMHPEYAVFTWVLCLIALASALKLYYLVKTALATVIVLVYALLILVIYRDLFTVRIEEENAWVYRSFRRVVQNWKTFVLWINTHLPCFIRRAIPLSAQMLIFLGVFLVMVTYHGRLVEVTSRLDFLWKQQAERELSDMIESRHNNMQLLKNILPDHVAHHFLTQDRAPEVRSEIWKPICFSIHNILMARWNSNGP